MVRAIYTAALLAIVLPVDLALGGSTLITDLSLHQQIAALKTKGYDVSKLDNHTQLKVFLYTWLAMERGEGG